ncbi:MAG: hypothetical protein J7L14_02050 [Candidatus Diapherotrites archaeon]|nr:hypothetical protein [Candidatus Diapherotrites archaeon]
MAKNKTKELKDFLISLRKKVGSGISTVPVWLIQKAGKRLTNPKQRRSWKQIDAGKKFRKLKRKQNR